MAKESFGVPFGSLGKIPPNRTTAELLGGTSPEDWQTSDDRIKHYSNKVEHRSRSSHHQPNHLNHQLNYSEEE